MSDKLQENPEVPQETEAPAPVEDSPAGQAFYGRKHFGVAVTWLVCAVLLIPCYRVTGIWEMAAIIPMLALLSAGAFMEGRRNLARLEDQHLHLVESQGFKNTESRISLRKINSILLDVSTEKNEEIVHSVRLKTTDGLTALPDIDDKAGFVRLLQKSIPGLKVEKAGG
jgi:hypothetical protein